MARGTINDNSGRTTASFLNVGAIFGALLGAFLGALVGPQPTFAQNLPEENSSPSGSLEDIQVRARRDLLNRFQSTGTRVNVTRQDIEAMGANTIGDILRQTPGLQVTTTANGGLEIRMRGMGPQDTRILIDGAPVSTSNRSSQLPLDELPADLIERVEVIRAPTAEFQGAAGGTLNIVLRAAAAKKETYIWLTDQNVWGHNAGRFFVSQTGPLGAQPKGKDPEAQANSTSWNYFVSLTGGHNQLGFDTQRATSASTSTSTSNGAGLKTSDLNYSDALRIKSNYWTLLPRVTGRIGASDKLTLRGVFSGTEQSANVSSLGQGLAGTSGTSGFTSNVHSPWHFERSFHQLGLDWGHSFKNSKWDTIVQFERASNDYRGDRTSSSNLGGVVRDQTSAYTENRRENAFYFNTKLTAAQGTSLWTFGAEHEKRQLEVAANTTVNQAVITPPAVPPAALPAPGTSTPADVSAVIRRSALWGQYELPVESAKTTLTLGMRAQDTEINVLGVTPPYQHLFWQPSINARTSLTEATQFRWNLARIVRNPRVWELNTVRQPNTTVNTANSPDFQGNANLRPQTTLAMDVGVDHRLTMGGQAGLNLFVRNQGDVIGRTLVNTSTGWLEQPGNIGNAIVWGLESDIRTNLKWIGLSADWTLSANASLLQSRMKDGQAEGQRIPGQARYLANLNIAKPLKVSGGWYGGASLSLVGASDYNTSNIPAASTTGFEKAHSQLDLYIGSVFPNLGFWRLNVFNVTDYRQDRSKTVVDNGIVYTDNFVRRLTPRWFLTIGTRF